MAADGNWTREFGKWKAEAAMFARKVKNARFSRSCGGRVYSCLWMSKLRYIATVVCFTQAQSEKINRKVVTQCLPASGFNRNFPRKVVFGPVRFGGMAWESCLSVQIMEKIKFIITHMRRMDKLGNLLKILLEVLQLQSGLCENILVTEIKWQGWVEKTWVHNLKDGLDLIGGKLYTNCDIPKTQRQYDRSIMMFFSSWNLSNKEMKVINRCRIYLQVIFISDIAKLDGVNIEPCALEVISFRDSKYNWARQVRPIRADRNIWRKCLEKLCYNGELIPTLGTWKCTSHQLWPYMTSPDENKLYRYMGGIQKELLATGIGTYQRDGRIREELEHGIPVDCNVTTTGYRVTGGQSQRTNEIVRPRIFKTKDSALNKNIGYIKSQDLRLLRERWKEGDNWYIGTDGGLKANVGTVGVTLYNRTIKKELCSCMSAEQCGLKQLHSTREEIRAVVAAEAMISECNKHFGYINHKIEYICDSKSALGKIKYEGEKQQVVSPMATEAELLMELTKLREDSNNIDRSFRWVKSHQDKKMTTSFLSKN